MGTQAHRKDSHMMPKFQNVEGISKCSLREFWWDRLSAERMSPTEDLALFKILDHLVPADTTLTRQHEHRGSNQFRLAEFSVTVIILMMDRGFYLGGRGHQLPVSTDWHICHPITVALWQRQQKQFMMPFRSERSILNSRLNHLQDESLAEGGHIPECNSPVIGARHQQVCCGNTTGSVLLDEQQEAKLKICCLSWCIWSYCRTRTININAGCSWAERRDSFNAQPYTPTSKVKPPSQRQTCCFLSHSCKLVLRPFNQSDQIPNEGWPSQDGINSWLLMVLGALFEITQTQDSNLHAIPHRRMEDFSKWDGKTLLLDRKIDFLPKLLLFPNWGHFPHINQSDPPSQLVYLRLQMEI